MKSLKWSACTRDKNARMTSVSDICPSRYLMVECEDDGTPTASKVGNSSKTSHKDMYSAVIRRLLTELRLMGPKGRSSLAVQNL